MAATTIDIAGYDNEDIDWQFTLRSGKTHKTALGGPVGFRECVLDVLMSAPASDCTRDAAMDWIAPT